MSVTENMQRWLNSPRVSEEDKKTIRSMDEETRNDAFYKNVEFGTAGMRGILGPGTNRINYQTIGRANVAYAKYILSLSPEAKKRGIVISHDNRFFSREFTLFCAKQFNDMGIDAYIFDGLRPTPELSFAVRQSHAIGGVMITASHNPKEHNGYKVYDETGCQLTPDKIKPMFAILDAMGDELSYELPEAKQKGKTIVFGPEMDNIYCEKVEGCQLNPQLDKKGFKVIYTPQHGASYECAMKVFQDCGYEIIPVKEQCVHDPAFGATKSPNPEVASSWELALEYAKKYQANLVVMTDPDGDRCGLAYLSSKGTYERLTGNQSGALLIDYLLSERKKKGILPKDSVMYDTIVTSSLGRDICAHYGVKVESFLTGFKFIGSRIAHYEEVGHGPEFAFGYEESYGCLIKPFVRDKDGVQAILMYTEMALYYHRLGKTLDVAFDELQKRFAYHVTEMKDAYFEGMEGAGKMKAMMDHLHASLFKEIAGIPVVQTGDYLRRVMIYADGKEEPINLPPSDVMKYILKDGSTLCVRPSGTEPKVKFYIEAVGKEEKGLREKVEAIDAFIRKEAGL